ncbi:unnamed protein product [Sphenostylis stenocarpa]|uniref:C3H1-type domain-containing protein n=1 Tax=Sphenostylis stenocarpa TaxID=92480 RepID=A0AA86S0M6_9FABA|nr:unnamed protein product [Sphenostylis stenocarpa]
MAVCLFIEKRVQAYFSQDQIKKVDIRRGLYKDDIMNKDYRVSDAQNTDNMKMSPTHEDCKNKYSQSPKTGCSSVRSRSRSRSRSKSPPRSFRCDSKLNHGNGMRARGLTLACRDFASGMCRRGSQCRFLHSDNQKFDDSWVSRQRQDGYLIYYAPLESANNSRTTGRFNGTCINYAKGSCRMGASCKYVHHENSNQFNKASVVESTREMEIDRSCITSSLEQGGRRGTNQSSDNPCKFFAFGNCRNGNYCRFSHDRQACWSPDRGVSGGDQALDRPKLSDEVGLHGRLMNDKWDLDSNMADVDNKNGVMGGPETAITACSFGDGWGRNLDKNKVHGKTLFSSDMKEANIHTSQSVGKDIWPDNEKMSPDWNHAVRPSIHIEEKHEQSKQQVAPGNPVLDVPLIMHPCP